MAIANTPRVPETIDGTTLKLVRTPQRRKPQLTSLEGVRCELARLYREAEAGKRDTQEASRLTYILTQIGKVLELTEIERRLIRLESKSG